MQKSIYKVPNLNPINNHYFYFLSKIMFDFLKINDIKYDI